MARLTYLQIVQRVASAIDSDNVTAIDESPESEQIAELVKTVYDDLMSEFPWYHKRETIQLEVTATAHIMKIPNDVEQLASDIIYYDNEPVYYWHPDKMRDHLANQDTSLSTIDSNGAQNDKDPSYWSSYDDENIIFDSYDGTLVQAETAVWAIKEVSPPETDTDVPDMPNNLHPVLLWGVMEEAFRTLKGDETAASRYGRKYQKGKARAKRWARKTNQKENPGRKIDYGRRNGLQTRYEISTDMVRDA